MKRLVLIALAFVVTACIYSCNAVDNDGKTRIIHDSIVNVLPTWQALEIHVKDDNTNMHIVVGDATLFKASDDVKKQKTQEVARMVLRIYGKGNYLEKGTLTVTADVKNNSETPADGIDIPIDFAAIKKEMGQ